MNQIGWRSLDKNDEKTWPVIGSSILIAKISYETPVFVKVTMFCYDFFNYKQYEPCNYWSYIPENFIED